MSTNPYQDDKRLLELLERWQSGDFTRADEQELQLLADSDEFRRETVAGFWSHPEADHVAHLASLKSRLSKRNRPQPLRGVAMRWLMAAAAVAVVAVAVIWLIPQPSLERESLSLKQTPSEAPETSPIASNLPAPSTGAAPTEAPALQKNDAQESPAPKRSAPDLTGSPAAQPAAPMNAAKPTRTSPDDEVVSMSRDRLESAEKQPEVPSAAEAQEYSAVSDELKDVDAGYGNSMGKSMQKKAQKAANKKKAPARTIESQPKGGWDLWAEYLRQNARLPETARQNNVSGILQMQFRLNEKNQPVDFKTIKGLGYGCEEAAIQLIQSYNWERANADSFLVDIPFIR